MSTHNICFHAEIRKVLCGYPRFTGAMQVYPVNQGSNTISPSLTVADEQSLWGLDTPPQQITRNMTMKHLLPFSRNIGEGWGYCQGPSKTLQGFKINRNQCSVLKQTQTSVTNLQVRLASKFFCFFSHENYVVVSVHTILQR